MRYYKKNPTALIVMSAVFSFSPLLVAQAPVIDASVDRKQAASATPPLSPKSGDAAMQGELFYQLQLLQQEVMELRGMVEEQNHQLREIKDVSQQRYIELDSRMADMTKGGATSSGSENTANGTGFSTTTPVNPAEKQAYTAAYQLVIEKRFSEALSAFKKFLKAYPDSPYAANSYYWMGEIYLVADPANLAASRDSFAKLVEQFPDHAKAPDAMYKLGKVYFLLGEKRESRKWLDRVIAEYGQSGNAAAKRARDFIKESF